MKGRREGWRDKGTERGMEEWRNEGMEGWREGGRTGWMVGWKDEGMERWREGCPLARQILTFRRHPSKLNFPSGKIILYITIYEKC